MGSAVILNFKQRSKAMKINVDQAIRNLEGELFKESDGTTIMTLKKILVRALVLQHASDEKQTGDEKFTLYQLASKITNTEGELTVSPEEIVILKKRVGLMYATVMVGPVYEILNG
jgi:hypothetical protein